MKLTNEKRDVIINRAITATFKKREEWESAESNALAVMVYDRIYEPIDQDKMKRLDDGFMHETSNVFVSLAGVREKIMLHLASSKRIAAKDHDWKKPCWDVPVKENNAITRRIMSLEDKRNALTNDKSTLKKELKTLLYGLNTFKQLEETWPEGKLFYRQFEAKLLQNAPAVRPEDVIKMMAEMEQVL